MSSRYEDNRRDSRKRRGKKKKGGGVINVLLSILLVIALGVFGYSGYRLYGYYKDYKAGTDEYNGLADQYADLSGGDVALIETDADQDAGVILTSVEELEDPDETVVEEKIDEAAVDEAQENGETKTLPLLVNPINFDELTAINEDIIGWIRVGALDISYPIAQGEDNDYYLHRTFEGQDNFAGCIFLNYSNSRYFTDQNSIVYGHNMKNGSMFGTLKNFRDQETYDANPYFWIFTPTLIYQYRIFAAREVEVAGDSNDVYQIRYTTENFQKFIDTALSQNLLDNHGMEVTTDDRIVTLSTCTGNDATRFIVQGELFQIYIAK